MSADHITQGGPGSGLGVRGCVGVGLAWRRVLWASVGGELGEWLDEGGMVRGGAA